METVAPTKNEIGQIFKRLRAVKANKVCFDCNSLNPTWSSISYGVFICIDCSGIHRSLGVHLTFVRSTILDSNWTWQQLRQMQLGGNENARAFFRERKCDLTDIQRKYSSRAAQLYREKLSQAAAQALRQHGTKLFIEAPHNAPSVGSDDEGGDDEAKTDFFETTEKESLTQPIVSSVPRVASGAKLAESVTGVGPNVEAAFSTSPTAAAQNLVARKSTIGQRKPAGKKGLNAKKGGLGAQKVAKDFAEIEREAELADQVKVQMKEEASKKFIKSAEDEASALASMRLAYQDLSIKQNSKVESLKQLDPKKAAQAERLGMGGLVAHQGGKSHSVITEINSIEQEEPRGSKNLNLGSFSAMRSDDEFEIIGGGSDRDRRSGSGNGRSGSSVFSSSGFDGFDQKQTSNLWEKEFEVMKTTNVKAKPSSEWSNTFDDSSNNNHSKPRRPETLSTSSHSSVDAQKKFGSAKAISSDMYFGNDVGSGPDANLSRFQGSSSISSAEYFGRNEAPGGRGGSGAAGLATPDLEDVKESVRQGVTKVAGRLSNMASGVFTSLQDKYGY